MFINPRYTLILYTINNMPILFLTYISSQTIPNKWKNIIYIYVQLLLLYHDHISISSLIAEAYITGRFEWDLKG